MRSSVVDVELDFAQCLRAVRSHDARFDGCFVTAVRTTKIYCRPSCPARPPLTKNLQFLPTAAAAQVAGFRACKRCRPDASPGSPQWNVKSDLVARAMRLIADGVVERAGVAGLAGQLNYSVRQVERVLTSEVGAGPLTLARAQRAQSARVLIEVTALPFSDVAFGAGFASVRQFNDTIREVYDATPTALRSRAASRDTSEAAAPGTIELRLPFRRPFVPDSLFGHLAATAVDGCEEVRDGAYRRSLRLPYGYAVVALTPDDAFVRCRLQLQDLRDLPVAVNRCRRLLDLDADPVAVTDALGRDDIIGSLVGRQPGRRLPGSVDGEEMTIRAILGQHVSITAARQHAARLVAHHGANIKDREGGLTKLFPSARQLLDLSPASLRLPERRRQCLLAVIQSLAARDLVVDAGADWNDVRRQLLSIPGVGPWTTEIIALRALGDPDAFPLTDRGVQLGLTSCGLTTRREVHDASQRWRPWRAYATQYLWATSDHAINYWPPKGPQ